MPREVALGKRDVTLIGLGMGLAILLWGVYQLVRGPNLDKEPAANGETTSSKEAPRTSDTIVPSSSPSSVAAPKLASSATSNNPPIKDDPPIKTGERPTEDPPAPLMEINTDDVLSPSMLFEVDRIAAKKISEGIGKSDSPIKLRECKGKLIEKGFTSDKEIQWDMMLTIRSSKGVGKIENVDLSPSSSWPSFFDEEIKGCFLNAFQGIEFPTEHDFKYRYTWPIVMSPIG